MVLNLKILSSFKAKEGKRKSLIFYHGTCLYTQLTAYLSIMITSNLLLLILLLLLLLLLLPF